MINGRVSVIIAGRHEKYFQKTVESVLESAGGDVEVVAIVDGELDTYTVKSDDGRVKIIELEKSIGQRAAYNLGVRESTGEYVMKIDAHCLLSKKFDIELKEVCEDKDVVLPEMKRLNVIDWEPKIGGETLFMHFGTDMYCHYWKQYWCRAVKVADGTFETMNGQGSSWFCKREWNDYIGLLDEAVGSWGNVGIEIALRTWLCGGRQTATKKAWQAHWFRKDDGGFPYHLTGRDVGRAHRYTRENYYFNDNAFQNQCRPFKWLIEKFAPVPGWEAYLAHNHDTPVYALYYTDSRLDESLANAVRKQIERVCGTIKIVSVSKNPLRFGQNIVCKDLEHSYESMYKEIKDGLDVIPDGAIVYLLEHDVFYHPSHFTKIPENDTHAFFNTNRWYWCTNNTSYYKARGKAALSQGVAYKKIWVDHVEKRLEAWKNDPNNKLKIRFMNFESERPNIDVRHGYNLTERGKYKKEHERNETLNVTDLPGWGTVHHMLKKVKYSVTEEVKGNESMEQKIDIAEALRNKWKKLLPQVSPIRCRQFKRNDMVALFGRLGLTKGAEVGVRQGAFSKVICESIPNVDMICVDPWDKYYHFDSEYGKKNYEIAKNVLAPYNAKLIKGFSHQVFNDIEDESLDFVYLDGDHRFDYVMFDLIVWGNKVRRGGIISGHDYYRFRNGGVVDAVDVYCKNNFIDEYWITDEKEASFYFVKK